MKYHIDLLDWRGYSFKFVRQGLQLSASDVLDYMRGPYEIEDIYESESVDAYLPVKDELVHIYNELLIAEGLDYRLHSSYVNYAKLPPKPKV